MTLEGERWEIWRDNEAFSQRFTSIVSPDQQVISGHWQKRGAAGDWEHDFAVAYRRVK
jgi:hypothetical protein